MLLHDQRTSKLEPNPVEFGFAVFLFPFEFWMSTGFAAPPGESVPLIRFYNKQTYEHTYSYAEPELETRRGDANFREQELIGYVSTKPLPDTVRLFKRHQVRRYQ